MSLHSGLTLLHYHLIEKIGEGGMGVVWKALDTTLDREVAIKVLPEAFSSDAGRLARFEREAKLLASLSHPNIGSIYGLHHVETPAGVVRFLAMELVAGETLAARLRRGPVPITETLELALQVVEALEAAHDNGTVHRDLKPANIQVTPDGKVKVLDFGLAKALEPESESVADSTHSPTLTFDATRTGVILGTAAYMSPEQARGHRADQRSDLWSFGVVLWEMLTGRRLFEDETVSDTLAAVLRAEPEWEKLPKATPPALRRLLRRCLTRAPRIRLHHAADARLEIEEALTAGDEEPVPELRRSVTLPWAVAAVLVVLVVALGASIVLHEPTPSPHVVFSLPPPEDAVYDDEESPATLSPDGTKIAVEVLTRRGREELAVRRLDREDYEILPVRTPMWDPFWSPDGRHVGFFAWRTDKLMKIDVGGGPPLALADAPEAAGGTWNDDGVIVFSPEEGPLYRVGAAGGDAKPVTSLDPERGERWHVRPHFLPDGRRFLYLALDGPAEGRPENGKSLWVGSLDGDPPRRIPGAFESAVSYAPPDFLLYQHEGTVLARRIDLSSLAWRGEPMIVAQGVDTNRQYAFAGFSVSRNGVLLYHPGAGAPPERKLVWRDRRGALVSEVQVPGSPVDLDLSPDGLRAAVQRVDEGRNVDIWIVELERETHRRLTFSDAPERGPVWSPDGRRVAYTRGDPDTNTIFVREATGAGDGTAVFESREWINAVDWSPDGQFLIVEIWADSGDLLVVPIDGGEPVPLADSQFNEHSGRFSPDGKWISYQSNETDRSEIYVQPWPPAGGKWLVSTAGGRAARWSTDGKEIFYWQRGPGGGLMTAAVAVEADGTFRTGIPQTLFELREGDYEPSPDGQRFLVVEDVEELEVPPAKVVLNWPALLEQDR